MKYTSERHFEDSLVRIVALVNQKHNGYYDRIAYQGYLGNGQFLFYLTSTSSNGWNYHLLYKEVGGEAVLVKSQFAGGLSSESYKVHTPTVHQIISGKINSWIIDGHYVTTIF